MAHKIIPSEEQETIINLINNYNIVVDCAAGSGKCHGINTPIIMYDGTIKMVQDIKIGDKLMGDDSTPRNVLSLSTGIDTLYETNPVNGDKYIFNSEHILCLKYSGLGVNYKKDRKTIKHGQWETSWIEKDSCSVIRKYFKTEELAQNCLNDVQEYNILEIPIKNYINLSNNLKKYLKIYRTGIEFEYKDVPLDPYIIGLWINDKNNKYDIIITEYSEVLIKLKLINNKHIPDLYKINSREIRLKLLAGIIDSDNHLGKNECCILTQINEKIIDDAIFLARSLGFSCNKKIKKNSNIFKISISGNIEEIPCKIPQKQTNTRQLYKDVLSVGFKLVTKELGTYYGFEIDGNHRYLLGDFTVTHNTSSVIFISERYPEKNILTLTYNSQLKNETRKKTNHLKNLSVHSYHSFCTTNYNKNAYTDVAVNEIIHFDAKKLNSFMYDVIIVDEAQDVTPLLYNLLKKIFKDNERDFKLVIMGDKMQSIYKFRESDSRFITMGKLLFEKFNKHEWKEVTLSESFRCTKPTIDFINKCVIGYDRIHSKKVSNYKPEYAICNTYGTYPRKVLENYLKVYKPEDIFILAYSIKDKTPIKTLANHITNTTNVPIFCSSSDQESLDSRIIEGKLVFTTIHQSKGRERKAVILLGFDESYFEYYDKNSDRNICPNELYVALTRSSERLTILHDQKNNMVQFLNNNLLKNFTTFVDQSKTKQREKKGISFKEINFTVTELVSYLPFSIENLCIKLIDIKRLRKDDYQKLNIDNIVKIENLYESVSDITGIAIPAYYEYIVNGKTTIVNKNLIENNIDMVQSTNWSEETKLVLITKLKKFSKSVQKFYKDNIEKINVNEKLSIENLLKISLYYTSLQNKTDYKLKQITKFDWLSEETLSEGINRLKSITLNNCNLHFEESIEKVYNNALIFGEMDCIDKNNKIVYEFKCTKTLTSSHIIQLAVYIYLHEHKDYIYRLYNIFTGELLEISIIDKNIESLMKILIEHKTNVSSDLTDEDFLKKCTI
jgi:hypothetical protein